MSVIVMGNINTDSLVNAKRFNFFFEFQEKSHLIPQKTTLKLLSQESIVRTKFGF